MNKGGEIKRSDEASVEVCRGPRRRREGNGTRRELSASDGLRCARGDPVASWIS